MSLSKERQLLSAAEAGRLNEVMELLKDGDIEINATDRAGNTALSLAALYNHPDVIEALLAMPNIMVNKASENGCTPLLFAVACERLESIIVLLNDSRVDVNAQDTDGATALWCAATQAQPDIVTWLFAYRAFVDTTIQVKSSKTSMTPLEAVQTELDKYDELFLQTQSIRTVVGRLAIVSMIIRDYIAHPVAGRQHALASPAIRDHMIPSLFAVAIFFIDNYLEFNHHSKTMEALKVMRFFMIASRLPIEVLMILCHRTFGSPKTFITSKMVEPHSRTLARKLLTGQ